MSGHEVGVIVGIKILGLGSSVLIMQCTLQKQWIVRVQIKKRTVNNRIDVRTFLTLQV